MRRNLDTRPDINRNPSNLKTSINDPSISSRTAAIWLAVATVLAAATTDCGGVDFKSMQEDSDGGEKPVLIVGGDGGASGNNAGGEGGKLNAGGAGGNVSTGGKASAGETSTGGENSGGEKPTGGAGHGGVATGGVNTGGDLPTGGVSTGGETPIGGAATGGELPTGGSNTGGNPPIDCNNVTLQYEWKSSQEGRVSVFENGDTYDTGWFLSASSGTASVNPGWRVNNLYGIDTSDKIMVQVNDPSGDDHAFKMFVVDKADLCIMDTKCYANLSSIVVIDPSDIQNDFMDNTNLQIVPDYDNRPGASYVNWPSAGSMVCQYQVKSPI